MEVCGYWNGLWNSNELDIGELWLDRVSPECEERASSEACAKANSLGSEDCLLSLGVVSGVLEPR